MTVALAALPPDPDDEPVTDFNLRELRTRFTRADASDIDTRHRLDIWDGYDTVRIEASRRPTPDQAATVRQLIAEAQRLLTALDPPAAT